jgi:hypothetical protein
MRNKREKERVRNKGRKKERKINESKQINGENGEFQEYLFGKNTMRVIKTTQTLINKN